MGFIDFLKGKKKESGFPEKRELEIPPAPPTAEELPEFPTPEAIPKSKVIEEAAERPPIPIVEKIERAAVETQEGELEAVEAREGVTKPIFIPLEQYKDIMDEIGLANNILKENEDILVRVGEFKEDEDKEFNKWENQIKDIQKKLIYADKTLFGSKG